MSKLTLKEIPLEGKRVFVRVDFNVPLSPEGEVLDDSKILASLSTLRYLSEAGARVVVATHLGRPRGQVVEELRLDPVVERLSRLMGMSVKKADGVIGKKVEKAVAELRPGEIIFLENIRFAAGEEKNDPQFAAALARLADVFVNDAFGTAHREHASNCGIARYLPAVAGLLMETEIQYLSRSRDNPPRPLVAVLGGRKVADKIGVIRFFLEQADALLLGGGMANTFLQARGLELGNSFFEEGKTEDARRLMEEAEKKAAAIYLPRDLVITRELRPNAECKIVLPGEIPPGWHAVDLGPETVAEFSEVIRGARMVLWNGPLGAYEVPPFDRGTEMIARAIVDSGAESIIGGGDIVAALEKLGLAERMIHLSTGGGAVLNFWEGKELPGIAALMDRSGAESK